MPNFIKAIDFSIENLTPQIAEIYAKQPNQDIDGSRNYLVLDMGEKKKGDLTTASFRFTSNTLKITSTSASCGCTRPSYQVSGENEYVVTVDFDSNKVANNTSKVFTLYVNNQSRVIKFNLVMNTPK